MDKALIVGVNYPRTDSQLQGCVNDSIAMAQRLAEKLGYADPLQRRMLVDASATKKAWLERIDWLVEGAQPGDRLFYWFSSHGTQVPVIDYDASEPDGLYEALVPIDYGDWRESMILDKEIKERFDKIPEGVLLFGGSDSCHSGDLTRGCRGGPNKARFLPMPSDVANRMVGAHWKNAPTPVGCDVKASDRGIGGTYQTIKNIHLSGCRSDQTSADAWIQKLRKYHGALTYATMQTWDEFDYNLTYGQMLGRIREILKADGYDQIPQLDCRSEYADFKFMSPIVDKKA